MAGPDKAPKMRRPLPDRLELRFPAAFRHLTSAVMRLPARPRRALIKTALDRAQDAFNRGDLEVIFAAFASDAEYQPPPQIPGSRPIVGRGPVLRFWRDFFAEWKDNRIENLEVIDAGNGKVIRRAALRHVNRASGTVLEYQIEQETQFTHGSVTRQINRELPNAEESQ